jgi:hypothetical protein
VVFPSTEIKAEIASIRFELVNSKIASAAFVPHQEWVYKSETSVIIIGLFFHFHVSKRQKFFVSGWCFMALELNTCSNELGEILKVVDESVWLLNHVSDDKELSLVRSISEKVAWSLEKVMGCEWVEIHSQLHELIYYMDLACFSLLEMKGESFQIYLQEVNQRYRSLLRALYSIYLQRVECCRCN